MKATIEDFLEKFVLLFDEIDGITISGDTKFRDITEWSSLTALSLIAMVDEYYSTPLTGEDVRTSETVRDLFEKICSK